MASAEVDWSRAESVIEYLVAYSRVLAGARPFDEAAARDFVRRDVARARDFAAAQNHDLLADGERPGRGAVRHLGADAGDPRHRGPDVPDCPRGGAGG